MFFRKKVVLLLIFVLSIQAINAQVTSLGLWREHLPYSKGVDIARRGDVLYCATTQSVFTYDIVTEEITRLSKLTGLSDIGVKAIAYSPQTDYIIVGYENANIDLIKGDEVVNIADILRATGISRKTINHILPIGDDIYVSCGFGIVVINVPQKIVKDTYFIGVGATELTVNELAFDEDNRELYAATESGVFKVDIDDPLLLLSSTWQSGLQNSIPTSQYNTLAIYNGFVYAVNKTPIGFEDDVYRYDITNGLWNQHTLNVDPPVLDEAKYSDVRVSNGLIFFSNSFSTSGFDENNVRVWRADQGSEPFSFTPVGAEYDTRENLWLIDPNSGLVRRWDNNFILNIVPNSPASNSVQAMSTEEQVLWVAPGSINAAWESQFNNEGVFNYDRVIWEQAEYTDFIRDAVSVTINPNNSNQVFVCTWGSGLLEYINGEQNQRFSFSNTGANGLQRASGTDSTVQIGEAVFYEGDLWMTNSLVERPLVVMRADGTWENFSLGAFSPAGTPFKDLLIDENGTKWLQTRNNGIVVFNESPSPQVRRLTTAGGEGNLESVTVLSFAEDQDGEVWVGTNDGVSVFFSPDLIFTDPLNADAQPILIEQGGNVERLFSGQSITTIAIDGANKKWFGTSGGGAFYTSEDGTEQIHHFTAENSPLLSNNIIDIVVNPIDGQVYFGTDKGIISFQGSATEGTEDFQEVFAYPNPVRPDYRGPIAIRGLVTNAQVKITDVAGNLVFETVAEGGQAIWSGNNFSGERVASGVYLAFITNDDGGKTFVTKIVVVN